MELIAAVFGIALLVMIDRAYRCLFEIRDTLRDIRDHQADHD